MELESLFEQYAAAHKDPRNKLCHKIGIPMIVVSIVALLFTSGQSTTAWVMFGVGWAFQFVGHAFERTWPEFLKNPIFLIVGPLYFVKELKAKLNKSK